MSRFGRMHTVESSNAALISFIVVVAFGSLYSLYVLLRMRQMERHLKEAADRAPVKQIADIEAFVGALKSEFTNVMAEIETQHDRWKREQASLRTWIHTKLKDRYSPPNDLPDKITAEEAAQMLALPGGEPKRDEHRTLSRREIRESWYRARGLR